MAWWELTLLVALLAVLLFAVLYLAVRSTRRGKRFLRLPIAGKIQFAKALARDPEIPAYAKGILAVTIAYLALPFDLIPDFIPWSANSTTCYWSPSPSPSLFSSSPATASMPPARG